MRDVENIQTIEEESSEEEIEKNVPTFVTPNVGELLVTRRALHVTKAALEPSPREQIFHVRCIIRGKCVNHG